MAGGFTPSPEQTALWPEISGNEINGLGETASRQPSPIYWHSPKKLAFGALQTWMLERTQRVVPEVRDLRVALGGRGTDERAPKAAAPRPGSPTEWSRQVKSLALDHEADQVGIARFDPDWCFEGQTVDLPWIVVMVLEMDHAALATAPEPASVIEVMRQYNRGTRAARALADWIRSQGYEALPHGGPQAGPAVLIPAAIACGLGELGKHGSLIGRRYGASFRLAAVLTDMPLVADQPDPIHVDDFCAHCQLCTQACPPDAIADHKQMVRGVRKWYVDFDRCVPYFNETQGCGICIAVCPWSRPGVAPRLAEKMVRRHGGGK